ncbi:Ig-like domain-containing protein [Oceanithermus desulfurans]
MTTVPRYFYVWILAFFPVLLAACGSPPPPADTTPPRLVSHTPADGATGVDLHAPLLLTFSEAIAPDSVTSASVKLSSGGASLDYAHTLSSDKKTLTLTLTSFPAASPAPVTVELQNVSDLAGNLLAATSFGFESADVTAPELQSHVPADGATGVLLADEIVLVFSEAVDPASVTPATVAVRDGATSLGYTASYNAEHTEVRLTLQSAPASLPTRLDVAVSGVKDAAGNPSAAAGFGFDTAAEWAAMGGSLDILSNKFSQFPQVAAGTDGSVVVTFTEPNNYGGINVFTKRWNAPAESWELLGSGPVDGAPTSNIFNYAAMTLDGADRPLVAYTNGNDGMTVKRWVWDDAQHSSGSWQQLGGAIAEAAGAQDIGVAAGADGTVAVIWWNQVSGQYHIQLAVWNDANTSWDPLGAAYSQGVSAQPSPVVVDSNGTVYYTRLVSGGVAVNRWDGASWQQLGAVVNHQDSDPNSWRHKLALGPGDELYLASNWDSGTHVDRWNAAAGQWDALGGAIATETGATTRPLALAVDSQGVPLLILYQDLASGQGGWVMRWNDASTSWDTVGGKAFSLSNADTWRRASLATDGHDLPLISWYQEDGSSAHVLVERYNGLAR